MPHQVPRVFIGSSSERMDLVELVQVFLQDVCDTTPWNQRFFDLSSGTLENLAAKAPEFDFAVLILSDDDIGISRGSERRVPRDNVLFELGLFIGAVGRDRTFMIASAEAKLPSDLAGVTVLTLDERKGRSLQSAVASICVVLKTVIRELGPRQNNNSLARLLEEMKIGVRTRYAGSVPDCFQLACRLLRKARENVMVLCDFPCYGIFSCRRLYNRYESILKKLIESDISIEFIFPNAECRRELQEIQFGNDQRAWSNLIRDDQFKENLKVFEKREKRQPKIDSIQKFHECLESVHDRRLLRLATEQAQVYEISEVPRLFMWIVDKKRAVFTIPMVGSKSNEQGFYSSEPEVLDALVSVWTDWKERRATPRVP
ncbi:MAG: TIR domain-containing protein [Planctomycetales bacterium]